MLCEKKWTYRASFSHLLHSVRTHYALFEKQNNIFSVKPFKTICHLEGCCISNALNLENLEEKTHNCSFGLFSLYHKHALTL